MARQHINDEAGFSAVEGLLVLIIVLLVGFIGYYVWHTNKQANSSYNSASKVAESTPATKKSTPAPATDYLKIPEFGVEISLTANTKDAYYTIRSDDPAVADLSTHSLTALDAECAASASSTAAVSYFTDPNAQIMTGTYAQRYPNAAHIGDRYFYIEPGNGPCSGKSNVEALQLTQRDDFSKATIKAID